MDETEAAWADFQDRYFCPNDGSALVRDDEGCRLFPGTEMWDCPVCDYTRGWTGVADAN